MRKWCYCQKNTICVGRNCDAMRCCIIPRVEAWCFPVLRCHGHVFGRVGVWSETLGNGKALQREHLNWFLNGLFLKSTSTLLAAVHRWPFSLPTRVMPCLPLSAPKKTALNKLLLCIADTWSDPNIISTFSWTPLFQQLHYFTDDSLLISSKLWISLKNSQYLISTAWCTQCLGMAFFCGYALFVSEKNFCHILHLHL